MFIWHNEQSGRTNFRNQQKIKDEQINFLLGDLEKNLEDYRQALEVKEKQLSDAKRILISAKQSYDTVTRKNRDLKAYIQNLKQHFQKEQQKQQLEFLKQQKTYYHQSAKKPPKKVQKSNIWGRRSKWNRTRIWRGRRVWKRRNWAGTTNKKSEKNKKKKTIK